MDTGYGIIPTFGGGDSVGIFMSHAGHVKAWGANFTDWLPPNMQSRFMLHGTFGRGSEWAVEMAKTSRWVAPRLTTQRWEALDAVSCGLRFRMKNFVTDYTGSCSLHACWLHQALGLTIWPWPRQRASGDRQCGSGGRSWRVRVAFAV